MRAEDYIYKLKIALKGKIPADRVKYYTKYYEDYINEQVRMGKKLADVLDELGDPNLIAKTIIITEQMDKGDNYQYDSQDEKQKNLERIQKRMKIEKIIGLITLLVIVLLVLSIILKIVTILLKLVLPVILIFIIYTVVKNLIKPKA